MENELAKTVKDLAEFYDKDSKNTFVSVYYNKNGDRDFIDKRVNACSSLLDKYENENFLKTIDIINDFLKGKKDKNYAVFASKKFNFFDSVILSVDVYNALIVDSSPYIRPLVRILDEWESFIIVVINSNQSKIFSVYLGNIDRKKRLSTDIINKHKKGGWSQARFQRIRKGAIHNFLNEVSDYLLKNTSEKIVLAGPGPTKIQFMELVPKNLKDRIIDVIDVDFDDENKLFQDSIEIAFKHEKEESHNLVQRLKAEILKDGLGVFGFDETLKSVKNGQVDILLVEKDYKVKGCICEHCQILKAGPIKDCHVCGMPTSEADVIEEIIEFAERTGARVEFSDDVELSKLGHIGGILRYR